jgi:hypothetical protein
MNASIGSALIALLTLAWSSSTLAADNSQCLHLFTLKPNERVSVASVVSDGGMYQSRVLDFAGRVATEDGLNKLAEVYLNHKDAVRWGKNKDIRSATGPLFSWRNRLIFLGQRNGGDSSARRQHADNDLPVH